MQFPAIIAAAYGLPAAYTLVHLIRTGRPGLRSRIRQLGGAALWPAYWLAVHGASCIAGRARAMTVQVAITTLRVGRSSRLPRRALVVLTRASGRGVIMAILTAWAALKGGAPAHYLKHYRMCRRGGLSRRCTIRYAWWLTRFEPRRVSVR